MTNVQLFLTIGIPSILIVLTWVSNISRFAALEKRIDGVDGRIDDLSARLDGSINSLADSHHRDMLQIMQALTGLHERVAVVESKQA